MRSAAYSVAAEARRLAGLLDPEVAKPDWEQPAWRPQHLPELGQPGTPYTRAALELLDTARRAVAAAVTADRAAGYGWTAIGDALGVSPDTAARRYRTARNDVTAS
ncbi:hypothetical protein ACFWDI_40410 [Streptomyces sp. NPDC060064]|uniref:hypothetical protein n=1 Tax=Streptomyces sp. NPDC060064 TaxID=3347049 RepID=UPI00368D7015